MKRLIIFLALFLSVVFMTQMTISANPAPVAYQLHEAEDQTAVTAINGGYAYVASAAGFSVFDIHDPGHMEKAAQLDGIKEAAAMHVSGSFVYIISQNHLFVLDLAEPRDPHLQTDIPLQTDGRPLGFSSDGNLLYIYDQSALYAFFLEDPARPVLTNTYRIGGTPEGAEMSDVAIRGGIAYVAMGKDGAAIYDLSNPEGAAYLGKFAEIRGLCTNIDFYGNLAFLRIENENLTGIIDISNLLQPQLLTLFVIRQHMGGTLEMAGHFALLPDSGNKIHVIDLSDLADIKAAGSVDMPAQPTYIHHEGERIYTVDELGSLNVIDMTKPPFVKIDPNQKTAYITIDDGPFRNYTPGILDTLEKYGVKATFFVVPKGGMDNLYQRILDEGHVLGNHSNSHDYGYVFGSKVNFEKDLLRARDFVLDRFGYTTTVYRFPGGTMGRGKNTISARAEILTEYGYRYFDWDVSTADTDPNLRTYGSNDDIVNILVNNVVKNTKSMKKLIILMHDGKSYTAQALPKIIEGLQKQGYIFDVLTNY